MLQKFAMVKYGVFVAKICKHALCASTVRDIWWSPLARQLLPPCSEIYPMSITHPPQSNCLEYAILSVLVLVLSVQKADPLLF